VHATKRTQDSERARTHAARIGAAGHVLVVPAASPYDCELLCEHAVASARQHGAVRLRINGADCVVRSEAADSGRRCAACGRSLTKVSFHMTSRDVCLGCARRSLISAPRAGADAELTSV
jgi:hypothetical protein